MNVYPKKRISQIATYIWQIDYSQINTNILLTISTNITPLLYQTLCLNIGLIQAVWYKPISQ